MTAEDDHEARLRAYYAWGREQDAKRAERGNWSEGQMNKINELIAAVDRLTDALKERSS